jgi:hypothetical protein
MPAFKRSTINFQEQSKKRGGFPIPVSWAATVETPLVADFVAKVVGDSAEQ